MDVAWTQHPGELDQERWMVRSYRSMAVPVIALVLAACGGSGTTAPRSVTQAEVSGVYAVCSLVFQPAGLAAVNLVDAAMEPAPDPPLPPPNLKLSAQVMDFELEYTPRGDVLPRRFTGTYLLGPGSVTLQFAATETALGSALLLTRSVPLDYQSSGQLDVVAPRYTVSREDYGRFAGLTEEQMRNLQQRIEGTLTGQFARGSCT
jgi:hypothetical protein